MLGFTILPPGIANEIVLEIGKCRDRVRAQKTEEEKALSIGSSAETK